MITRLEVENFKALRGKHDIPIAPITLLYGPNSGGKSSVIQALLLLKQSMDAGRFTARGNLVDLGSFQSCVWQHDVSRPLRLGLTCRGSRLDDSRESDNGDWGGPELTSLSFTFRTARTDVDQASRVRLDALRVQVKDGPDGGLDVRLHRDGRHSRRMEGERFVFSGTRSKQWLRNTLAALELPHSPSELALYCVEAATSLVPSDLQRRPSDQEYSDAIAATDVGRQILGSFPKPIVGARQFYEAGTRVESVLGGLRYLGPIRVRPSRAYSPLEATSTSVGSAGEFAAQRLLRGMSSKSFGFERQRDRVARWLRLLDIPYQIRVTPVGDQVLGDGIRTILIDQRTRVAVGLADVGSGVGQILPLLIQAAFGDAQVLCVEQPELHLHPRAQAALGDVMLELAGGVGVEQSMFGGGSASQWIVETHSETLLLRLKRRIREKRLSPESVCVLYVNPGKNGSVVTRLRMNERGDFIDEWPSGFFEDAFNEVFS